MITVMNGYNAGLLVTDVQHCTGESTRRVQGKSMVEREVDTCEVESLQHYLEIVLHCILVNFYFIFIVIVIVIVL